jgi:hypothetical protein
MEVGRRNGKEDPATTKSEFMSSGQGMNEESQQALLT